MAFRRPDTPAPSGRACSDDTVVPRERSTARMVAFRAARRARESHGEERLFYTVRNLRPGGCSMPTTIVHRGLTVWINPVERCARIQVHMPGYDNVHFVYVQATDGGWTVTDDREDEPTWFGTF